MAWTCHNNWRFWDQIRILTVQTVHMFAAIYVSFIWWTIHQHSSILNQLVCQVNWFRRVVLCVLANRIVTAASSGDNVQNPRQPWHVVTCDDSPHSTLYSLHSKLYILQSTLYTPYSTLYTPAHSTLHTPHSTLYTLHSTLYTLHSALCIPHSTL